MKYYVTPKVKKEYGFCNASGCQSKSCNEYTVDTQDGIEIHITWKCKTK